MGSLDFPVIDMIATGKNILSLRREKGFTVRDLQEFFGFEEPQAIYRWQYGKTLPSVDNLYALSAILGVTMEEILVPVSRAPHENNQPHQEKPDAAFFIYLIHARCVIPVVSVIMGKAIYSAGANIPFSAFSRSAMAAP